MILASHGIIASQIASFDADAVAFFTRVTTAGGTLSTTEKQAVNQLVLDLKANSLWTPMKAIYPMVGASAAACAQNLKSSSFTGTFTSGWTFASTGVTPNGTSAYMGTGLNMLTNLSLTSTHLSFYSRTNIAASGYGIDMGNAGAYNGLSVANLRVRNSAFGLKAFAVGEDSAAIISSTNALGLTTGVSSSLTSRKLFANSTLLATATALNTGTMPNQNLLISSGTGAYGINECAFSSCGESLSDLEVSYLYTAVQAFQTTLSRQV